MKDKIYQERVENQIIRFFSDQGYNVKILEHDGFSGWMNFAVWKDEESHNVDSNSLEPGTFSEHVTSYVDSNGCNEGEWEKTEWTDRMESLWAKSEIDPIEEVKTPINVKKEMGDGR